MPAGIVRYDAWPSPVDTNHHTLDARVSTTFETDWNSRTPTLGWSMYGTGVDSQAHADATTQYAADAGIDFFAFLVHLPPEIYSATIDHDALVEAIQIPFNRYLTSPQKSRIKFLLMMNVPFIRYPYNGYPGHPSDSTSGGAYITQWGTWVGNHMLDPQYQRFSGKPGLGVYNASDINSTMWNAFKAQVEATCGCTFTVIDWARNAGAAPTVGTTVLSAYPPNPQVVFGNGQHPYSDVAAQDVTYATPAGFVNTSLVTAVQDSRCFSQTGIDAVVPWADQPTQPELVAHIAQMGAVAPSGFKPLFMSLHSWNEHAEDGPGWEPTVQEGTRYIDAFKWARYRTTRPTTYTYGLSTESLALPKTGAGWALARLLATSAWNNAEMVDSTLNDTISLTHIAWSAAKIFGSTCAACGSFEVSVDGAPVTTVSQTAGSTTRHVQLWSGSFAEGTHTVSARVVTGQVRLDEFEVTTNPSHFP